MTNAQKWIAGIAGVVIIGGGAWFVINQNQDEEGSPFRSVGSATTTQERVQNTPPATTTAATTNSGGNSAGVQSGVRGVVLLGPQCPVVREGEECKDLPFQTTISIFRAVDKTLPLAIVFSSASGTFEASLPPGRYAFLPKGGNVFPACRESIITVATSSYTLANLSCDTGIR
ncbi:MAG: hypothetical protein Q7R88_00075 [bacterium]|nr:hypothetical protein [bacterium]